MLGELQVTHAHGAMYIEVLSVTVSLRDRSQVPIQTVCKTH